MKFIHNEYVTEIPEERPNFLSFIIEQQNSQRRPADVPNMVVVQLYHSSQISYMNKLGLGVHSQGGQLRGSFSSDFKTFRATSASVFIMCKCFALVRGCYVSQEKCEDISR